MEANKNSEGYIYERVEPLILKYHRIAKSVPANRTLAQVYGRKPPHISDQELKIVVDFRINQIAQQLDYDERQ